MSKHKFIAVTMTAIMMGSVLFGCSEKGNTKKAAANQTQETVSFTPIEAKPAVPTDNKYGLRSNIKDGTILHCFSWSFKTITESMEDIAMAGYSTIQTSPINACYDGGDAGMELFGSGKWYYHYQPIDWTIGNYQLGTRDEFITMCETAHAYGIKVLVDVDPNHTTKATEALREGLLNAVGGIENLYHKNGMTAIANYSDRAQCTLQGVGGLYDVNTENPDFQNYYIQYLNDVIACGADGFRYDTAKHIGLPDDPQDNPSLPNNFWERVTTEVTNADSLFMYGECLQDGSERLADYIDTIGATTASSYGEALRNSLNAGMMSATALTDLKIGNATPNVVTWVESHDNYTGDDATGKSVSKDNIILGWSLLCARSSGTPLFFARPYGSSENNMWGTFNKIGMAGDELYKNPSIVAANRFRNAMTGLEENILNPNPDNKAVIAIERGTKGLVIINGSSNSSDISFKTHLEDGTYTDRITNTSTYTVKDSNIAFTIPGKSVIILYNEGFKELSNAAIVKVIDETKGNFVGDSIDVKLVSQNSVKSTYSIDNGEEKTFSDGEIINLGNTLKPSETLTLTLRGENSSGNKTCITYIFKKQDTVSLGTIVYFEKPDDWSDKVYCYVYDETSYSETKTNAAWPGKPMTVESDGTYSYTFTEEWIAPLIIFTDGNKQSNGALEPGEAVIADKIYSVK